MTAAKKPTSRKQIESAIRRSGRSARYVCPAPSRNGEFVVFGQFLDEFHQYFVLEFRPSFPVPRWHRFSDADDAFESYTTISGAGLCIDPSGAAERRFREVLGLK